jgi:hypothetical protein
MLMQTLWKDGIQHKLTVSTMSTEALVLFPLYLSSSRFIIKVCKDNQSCILMAENPKFTPQTKQLQLNTITFRSMSSLKQIQMDLFSLSIAPQLIRLQISLLNLSGMTFSTNLDSICQGGNYMFITSCESVSILVT